MWAPALARLVAVRTVDRGFSSPLSLRRWGTTGVQVILWPLVVPLIVYGAAYSIAYGAGLAHWSPGGGRWTTGSQIAANVIINTVILGVVGTLTAIGEEIGWRGYLQPPRLCCGSYERAPRARGFARDTTPVPTGMSWEDPRRQRARG